MIGFAAALAIPRAASAHAGIWRPDHVLVEPGNDRHILVRSDVWGMVETRDGGQSWQWFCSEAAHSDSLSVLRRPLVLLGGGTLLMGNAFDGVARSKDSFCDFETVPFFEDPANCGDCQIVDVAPDGPSAPSALALTTLYDAGQYRNRLFRTTDGGASWVELPATLPSDAVVTGVRVAPSDPARLYVGAMTITSPPSMLLYRSGDAGATFEQSTLPRTLAAGESPPALRIRAVAPNDPDVVFVWLDAADKGSGVLSPDEMLISADGGATFPIAFEAKNDLPGLAFAPNDTVFLGGTDDGVLSAAMDDVRAGVAGAFQQVNTGPTWGLAWTESGLLAGREEYVVQPVDPRMSLGLSQDYGVTFSPAMVLCDVTLAACDPGTTAGDNCPSLYYGDLNFESDFVKGRRCDTSGGTGDAGTAGTGGDAGQGPAGAQGGCSCRAARSSSPGKSAFLLSSLAVLLSLRRARRR